MEENRRQLISFVIPCYKSVKTLEQVVNTIRETVAARPEFDSEIILVNDCSPDGGETWRLIEDLHRRYDNIVGVDLAKNSGQTCAVMAGLRTSKGDFVTVSDDDGQTPINRVFEFYDYMQEGGFDVVCAHYTSRGKRSWFREFGSWMNQTMVKYFLDEPKGLSTSGFFFAKRFIVDEMVKYNNAFPHIGGLMLRTTHNIGNIDMSMNDRAAGRSNYNFSKLLRIWINGITTFSIKPLRITCFLGMLMVFVSVIVIIALIISKLTNPLITIGWTSMIATTLLVGGMILFVLGVIGEYIGRIYLSLNQNPQYVVRTVLDRENGEE